MKEFVVILGCMVIGETFGCAFLSVQEIRQQALSDKADEHHVNVTIHESEAAISKHRQTHIAHASN